MVSCICSIRRLQSGSARVRTLSRLQTTGLSLLLQYRLRPTLYAAIHHMHVVQGIINAANVTFYHLEEMISHQATLVNSQTPKEETPRKVNATQKEGGPKRGSNGGRGSGPGDGQGHCYTGGVSCKHRGSWKQLLHAHGGNSRRCASFPIANGE
jgi:hypothetical protein